MKLIGLSVVLLRVFLASCQEFSNAQNISDEKNFVVDREGHHERQNQGAYIARLNHSQQKLQLRNVSTNNGSTGIANTSVGNTNTGNTNIGDSKLITMLQSLKSSMDDSFTNINLQLGHEGCPEEDFFLTPSNQCFQLLNDTRRGFDSAEAKCKELGLQLAQPLDPVFLRNYLMAEYGLADYTWVGARGNGTAMTWQGTGQSISTNSSYWYAKQHHAVTKHHCLLMVTLDLPWKTKPNQPYISSMCMYPTWTLCELVLKPIDSKIDSIITHAGTIEAKLNNSEQKLKSLKTTLDTDNSFINMKLQYLENSMDTGSSNISNEFQVLKSGINTVYTNLRTKLQALNESMGTDLSNLFSKLQSLNNSVDTSLSKLDYKLDNQGCTKGTFLYAPTNQCFRLLNIQKRKYDDARDMCSDLGLQLAHPYDPLSLREYLITKYDIDDFTWLGARGTGSNIEWQSTNANVTVNWSNNKLFYSSIHRTTSYCMAFMTRQTDSKSRPTYAYYMLGCTSAYWALCELVR